MTSCTPMKKLLSRSLGALALLMLVSACRSSSLPELETKLERQGASDTLALVTHIGRREAAATISSKGASSGGRQGWPPFSLCLRALLARGLSHAKGAYTSCVEGAGRSRSRL